MAAYAAFLILASVLCPGAQPEGRIAQQIRQGQDALYHLDYEAAAEIFRQLIRQEPENPVGYGMLAVVYWNDLLAKTGNLATDDYATPTPFSEEKSGKLKLPEVRRTQDRFHEANSRLLEICDKRLQKNPNDVPALYFQGMHYENLAAEAVAITKRQTQAISYGRKARAIHQQVLALDPGFVDAYVSVAGHEFARATLPWSIKWIAFLLGIRGNKELAFQQFEIVAAKGFYRRLDAQVLLALLHSWKGDPNQAVALFRDLRTRYPDNYLLDINLAAILEQRLNDTQAALQVYRELLNNRKSKAWSVCPGEIHYRTGTLYMRLHDHSLALAQFEQAVRSRRIERETEPLAFFAMAQIYEQRNDTARAAENYRRVLHYQGPGLSLQLKTASRKVQ